MVRFYGQERIRREISYLMADMKKNNFAGRYNILLSAPSGYGKTTLAFNMIYEAGGLQFCHVGGPPDFYLKYLAKRLVFMDEIHLLEKPEVFYKYLDGGFTNFILATNEIGELKEPLANRCIPLVFDAYNLEEISQIVKDCLPRFDLPPEVITAIAEKCKLNPRIAKILSKRLQYVFSSSKAPKTAEELDSVCEKILDLSKEGLNALDRRYINVLRESGGRASIALITNSLHVDKATILRDIEPHLIHLNKIRITSKGREIL